MVSSLFDFLQREVCIVLDILIKSKCCAFRLRLRVRPPLCLGSSLPSSVFGFVRLCLRSSLPSSLPSFVFAFVFVRIRRRLRQRGSSLFDILHREMCIVVDGTFSQLRELMPIETFRRIINGL